MKKIIMFSIGLLSNASLSYGMNNGSLVDENFSLVEEEVSKSYVVKAGNAYDLSVEDKTKSQKTTIEFNDKASNHFGAPSFVLRHNDNLLFFLSKKELKNLFVLSNSQKVTFSHENQFIKINEIDDIGESNYYFDPAKPVMGEDNHPIGYEIFYKKPDAQFFNKESVINLLESLNLKDNMPKVMFSHVAFNRHGIALFGQNKKDLDENLFYWVDPEEKQLNKINCSEISLHQEVYHSFLQPLPDEELSKNNPDYELLAKDKQNQVIFKILPRIEVFDQNISLGALLNNEEATLLDPLEVGNIVPWKFNSLNQSLLK